MDTRSKILDWPGDADVLQRKTAGPTARKAVVGYFDPLLAAHARRLSEIANGSRVVAIVTSPERPVLPAAARAELAAALEVVEHALVVPPADLPGLLSIVPKQQVVFAQEDDARITEELIRLVRARQSRQTPS